MSSVEDFEYESPAVFDDFEEPVETPVEDETVLIRRVASTAGVVVQDGVRYVPRGVYEVSPEVAEQLLGILHRGSPLFVPADS